MDIETKTVGVVVLEDNKVLLVKHHGKSKQKDGVYGLPAGRVNAGEQNSAAAARELKEETGLTTAAAELRKLPTEYHAVLDMKNGKEAFVMEVFLCRTYSGDLTESDETVPEWISIDQLKSYNTLLNVGDAVREALQIKAGAS